LTKDIFGSPQKSKIPPKNDMFSSKTINLFKAEKENLKKQENELNVFYDFGKDDL